MTTSLIISIFLFSFFCSFVTEAILEKLQLKNQESLASFDQVIKDNFDSEILEKSQNYSSVKIRFSLFNHFFTGLVTLVVLFSGILPALSDLFSSLTAYVVVNQALFIVAVTLLLQIVSLPFSFYSTFKIEQEFGFNEMTIGLWLSDLAKSLILSLILATPLLLAVLAIIMYFPNSWWFWAFVLVTAFQGLLLYIYPVWIAPIFNKFEKLPEGELRDQIFELSGKLKFPLEEVFIMDGSKRSKHGNAYFTGFGKNQRIVLFDTLMKDLSTAELVAVLAHEIGHKKLKHVQKQLIFHAINTLAVFYIFSLIFNYPLIYQAFGFNQVDSGVGLVLIPMILAPAFYFFSPLGSILSRKYEYEADDYASEAVEGPEPLSAALVKLHESNLANLNPHPAYTFFHHSHPTLVERLRNLNNLNSA